MSQNGNPPSQSRSSEIVKSIGGRSWLFGTRFSVEEQERIAREEKIKDLLPEDEEALGKAYDGELVNRLLYYLRPYRVRIIGAVAMMIVSSLLTVAGPWLIGEAIDKGIDSGSASELRFWSIVF
ncbi:MAG: ABC transporter ATP-binding protein, partial [Caldilineaceae bacterium]|nr:ABC transporter ATP-binding protein [Caldilineaceae bacterium]